MRWLVLAGSIGFEILATTALKIYSQDGSNTWLWGSIMVISYLLCFSLLGSAMKHFELSALYAIWSAVGIASMAVIGVFFFGDQLTALRVFFLLMIGGGVVGLQLTAPPQIEVSQKQNQPPEELTAD